MGSSNRDYMQSDFETGQPPWGHDVPTTKWLVVITVVVFFMQSVLTHGDNPIDLQEIGFHASYVEDWCSLDATKVLQGQVWRLVTYVFCHHRENPFGLVFNMIALWYLGSALERMYGSREILCLYLTAAIACGLIFTAFRLKILLPFPLMGSSPCIMALFTLYATHFPRQEILFCWIIPVQIRILLFIYIALDLLTIINAFSGQAAWVKVAYLSGIWGIGFGYAYRRFGWHFSGFTGMFDLGRLQRNMRRASTSRNLKVFHPEPVANLDEQVDAILAKIHEQGSESLTERERAILQKASEQAKNRL